MLEPIPGTSDFFPKELYQWRFIEKCSHEVFSTFGFGEIRTPIIERSEVFMRSIGLESDIVQKEMYRFKDHGDRDITLRPEGTAGVLRAVLNAGISQGEEKRVYYIGPMFRGERPAAGRRRQFHQIGVENVGKVSPNIDIECIAMLVQFLQKVGLKNFEVLLNSRGDKDDRKPVSEALYQYFSRHIDSMCKDCQRRHNENVWRILDCKKEICREIILAGPEIVESLGASSKIYFEHVCAGLDQLNINYSLEPRLVRGLDYYVQTVFEVSVPDIGAQSSVVGGGRYEMSFADQKHHIAGVGFAIGIERLILAMNQQQLSGFSEQAVQIYLISLGEKAIKENLKLANFLRTQGYSVLMDLEGRGMKAQLRTANKISAQLALIRGETEIDRDVVLCKCMAESNQFEIPLGDITNKISNLLKCPINSPL